MPGWATARLRCLSGGLRSSPPARPTTPVHAHACWSGNRRAASLGPAPALCGGIAIARAFQASGLADATGKLLAEDLGIATWPAVLMIGGIALAVTFLTEVTSNTATTTLLMPVLAAAGVAAGIDPAVLMVPATLSASCAFMLPVATAPNAIVYGTGRVSTREMAWNGAVLNLVGVVVITALTMLR